ncbi:MAG: Npun_R2821/Npun_R2822 family protein [Actinomycetota bacterium]
MTDGIYTLANDFVYDQLVALLNSIEVNAGKNIPVCIIPYDDQLHKIRAEIATRKNVTLFSDTTVIKQWENFATQAWKAHSRAQKAWQARGLPAVYRLAMHRKFCSINGEFEKFIYFDADTLLMGPLDRVYEKLDCYDWVTNDFQYKSNIHYIFDRLEECPLPEVDLEIIQSHVFCAGWFASKKGVFNEVILTQLLTQLKMGEANIMALWGPDQSLLNYMVLRSGISYYNFAYHHLEQATGCHWSSHFDRVDQVLYDKGRRLTYLHYMSIPSSKFTQLCAGEDVEIPYQDVFLHYRYLKSPEQRPKLHPPSLLLRFQRKMKRFLSQKLTNLRERFRTVVKIKIF